MVVTDQYMQKMEKELTEVRQRVVRIETAMQKFLSQSTDMAKNARMEKEKGKKDEKNNGSLVTALARLREEGDRIGEQLGKAADHAISKIGDAFAGFLKNGKLDFSDVVRTLKTDLGSMATTQIRSLLATGLTKWLGFEASGTGSAARAESGTEKNGRTEQVAKEVSGNFFDALTQDIRKFFENGKTVFGDLIEYLGNIPGVGGVVKGIGNVASEAGGLFSGLGKSIGQFFGAGGTSSGENSMQAAGSAGSDAAKGMQQVAEEGKQSAGDMAKAMQDAMLRTQNVLIRFVETGKLSFKDLTRSILADIAQIMLKMTVSKLFGSIFGSELPLTVTQMLWVNLIMDTFAALALASLPPSRSVMREKPRKNSDFIISRPMMRSIVGVGLLFVAVLLGILYYFGSAITIYELSAFFTVFVMLQFWNMFNAKGFGTTTPIWKAVGGCAPFFGVLLLILAGQFIIVTWGGNVFRTVPLSGCDWLTIIGTTSLVMWGGELTRALSSRRKHTTK